MHRAIKVLGPAVFLLILSASCRLTPVDPPDEQMKQAIDTQDELEYFDLIKSLPRVSTLDGARLIAFLLGENPWGRTPEELKAMLIEREAIKAEWEISELAPLTMGKLAFMLCFAAKIRTSMIMQLSEPNERYALREAIYHELMKPASPQRYVSGTVLLDSVAKTDAYLEKQETK